MRVSVVLATRNRPVLFERALASVLAQRDVDAEVVVVLDGSDDEHLAAYEAVFERARSRLGDRLRVLRLVHRPAGHGQSYALNTGVAAARADYVAFLDDDDLWIDDGHLARIGRVVDEGGAPPPDLLFTNQVAYREGKRLPGPTWLEGLAAELAAAGRAAAAEGAYEVTVADLMATRGFCHLNTFVIRRDFYEAVGGMDEGIRWECDRDLYLRAIDRAGRIVHLPQCVSRHNVPAPTGGASMTTSLSMLDRRLYQLRVLDKAALFAVHADIRRHGLRHKGFTLKKIAETLTATGRPRSALAYAREALGLAPTVKWTIYTGLLSYRRLRAALPPRPRRPLASPSRPSAAACDPPARRE
jgi:glycosyltransferase involved in cell wall biosynthesis